MGCARLRVILLFCGVVGHWIRKFANQILSAVVGIIWGFSSLKWLLRQWFYTVVE